MAGLDLVNPALDVQALEFQCYRENWVGILITPWFMNLVLLPTAGSDWQTMHAGEKFNCRFPNGEFEFIVAIEQELGRYAACSLYSPMFQFNQQAVVVATAQAAWQVLFFDSSPIEAVPQADEPKALSRRDLLRGAIGSRKHRT